MQCPTCATPLTMTDRQGIEIDYCPSCRGVWLDRGELDKIIERSNAGPPPAAPQHQQQQSHYSDPRFGHHKPYKRRKSFLEDLFD